VKKALYLANVVHPSFIQSKAATYAMYHHFNADHLPRDRCKDKDNARIMAEVALATQDFDIILNLRELIGRPKSNTYDLFGGEIRSLLESHARVDDRRHDNADQCACTSFMFEITYVLIQCLQLCLGICFMSFAIYVRGMREQVVKRLRNTHPDLDAAGI